MQLLESHLFSLVYIWKKKSQLKINSEGSTGFFLSPTSNSFDVAQKEARNSFLKVSNFFFLKRTTKQQPPPAKKHPHLPSQPPQEKFVN